jgi:hypothetical protein
MLMKAGRVRRESSATFLAGGATAAPDGATMNPDGGDELTAGCGVETAMPAAIGKFRSQPRPYVGPGGSPREL